MSLQIEDGQFTRIVNEVLEKLALFPFPAKTGMPIRLALFVIRKTWGYQKKEDYISLTQFEKALVSNRPSVVHWLEYLVKANILVKGTQLATKGTLYRFNKYHEQWKWGVKATELVKARKTGWLKQATKSSNVAVTHKRKKEIYTKEIIVAKPLKGSFKNLDDFLNSPQRHIRFIGLFFQRKGLTFTNPAEWTQAGKQWMKTAAALKEFEADKVSAAFDKAEQWTPNWNLGTVLKIITGQNL